MHKRNRLNVRKKPILEESVRPKSEQAEIVTHPSEYEKEKRVYSEAPRPNHYHPSERSSLATCAFFSGISLLIFTITFALIALIFTEKTTNFLGDMWDDVGALFGFGEANEPEVVDTDLVVLGIKNMALLETTRSDILIEKTVIQEKTSVLKDARLQIRYIGRLTVGVDLSSIGEDDIQISPNRSISIVLPPANISGCYLQDPKILENTCGTSYLGLSDCSQIFEDLQAKAYAEALNDLRAAVEELNLLNEAYEYAQTTIHRFLRDTGFRQVSFERSSEILAYDSSCYP